MTHFCKQCKRKGLVKETRSLKGVIRRRLQCRNVYCRATWATYEVHEDVFGVHREALARVQRMSATLSDLAKPIG